MPRAPKFYPTGVYKRTAYKPHRSGGMLILFRQERIQIYCNYPDAMPWAADKRKDNPIWRNNRGCSHFTVGRAAQRVERHRAERHLAEITHHPYGPHPQIDALETFMDLFDPVHLQLLRQFPHDAWNLYTVGRRCPGLFELADSGDQSDGKAGGGGLAYALSNLWSLADPAPTQPLRTVRRLLKKPRKHMATRLGFESRGNLSAVKVLGKIAKAGLHAGTLRQLQAAMQWGDKHVGRLLGHAERLNCGALELLHDVQTSTHVTPALFDEVAHRHSFDVGAWELSRLLPDTVEMAELRRATLPPIVSLEQLKALHDEEVERLRPRGPAHSDIPLPPAPVEEMPGRIEYVSSSVHALENEGEIMHNCVGSYAPQVARGECYIYRVVEPERCTLAIAPDARGRFHVQQLSAHCNKNPEHPHTSQTVLDWLYGSNARAPEIGPEYIMAVEAAMDAAEGNWLDGDIPF